MGLDAAHAGLVLELAPPTGTLIRTDVVIAARIAAPAKRLNIANGVSAAGRLRQQSLLDVHDLRDVVALERAGSTTANATIIMTSHQSAELSGSECPTETGLGCAAVVAEG